MNQEICIITVSCNLTDKLAKCLQSIFNTGYRNIRIIIFDNGSTPSLKNTLTKYHPSINEIIVLRDKTNLGFAKANNICLKYALKQFPKSNYFLLLNNDAYVRKNFFTKSLPFLNKDNDLISPMIALTGNRGVDSMGIDYYRDGTAINRTKKKKNNYLLPAACLYVSRTFAEECFDKFGWLFIPCFQSYMEDVEMSLRALLMKKKLVLISQILVDHDRSSTLKSEKATLYLGIRNQLWTIITTWTNEMIRQNLFQIIKGQIVNDIVYFLKFKNLFTLKIYAATLLFLPDLLKTRRTITNSLLLFHPGNIFTSGDSITLKTHILRSRTYKKWQSHLRKLFRTFPKSHLP